MCSAFLEGGELAGYLVIIIIIIIRLPSWTLLCAQRF
jgi:hypothetical protein